tara:strand:- start:4740 stop:5030 length:291 start_codon:yes stop_codon:yes gene_type:complete
MTLQQFRLVYRICKCIDKADLPGVFDGYDNDHELRGWHFFRTDPAFWFCLNSGERADLAWSIVKKRFDEQWQTYYVDLGLDDTEDEPIKKPLGQAL